MKLISRLKRINTEMPLLLGSNVLLSIYIILILPIMRNEGVGLVIHFYGVLLVWTLLPLVIAYIVRFVLVRRKLHIAVTAIVMLLTFSMPFNEAVIFSQRMVTYFDPKLGELFPFMHSLLVMLVIIMGFFILRIKYHGSEPGENNT